MHADAGPSISEIYLNSNLFTCSANVTDRQYIYETMKIHLLITSTVLVFLACTGTKTSNTAKEIPEGAVKAEVRKYDVDGCGYMLFLEDGKKLNPDNLPEEFKKEGLKVWIVYGIKKDAMSICMAGDNVRISRITLRD